LRELPEWFGIPAMLARYVDELSTLPTWLALDDELVIGFLATKRHTPVASELYVPGLLPHYHRQGIGRRLLTRAEEALRDDGVRLVQAQTLGPSHPSAAHRANARLLCGTGLPAARRTTRNVGPG